MKKSEQPLIPELMLAIEEFVKQNLAVEESDLNREFTFTEDLQEIANIKAALIMLEEQKRIGILSQKNGGFVVVDINENTFH